MHRWPVVQLANRGTLRQRKGHQNRGFVPDHSEGECSAFSRMVKGVRIGNIDLMKHRFNWRIHFLSIHCRPSPVAILTPVVTATTRESSDSKKDS